MTSESDRVVVQTFDGTFDEKAESTLYNLATRKHCLFRHHEWVNASLRFEARGFYIPVEARKHEPFNPEWGTGYGGIRFCKRCKHIDCIHLWDRNTTYVVERGKYFEETANVSYCRCCKRRVRRDACHVHKPSMAAQQLLDRVLQELGKPPRAFGDNVSHYGSAWFCEVPTTLSAILDEQGEATARAYLMTLFVQDGARGH